MRTEPFRFIGRDEAVVVLGVALEKFGTVHGAWFSAYDRTGCTERRRQMFLMRETRGSPCQEENHGPRVPASLPS